MEDTVLVVRYFLDGLYPPHPPLAMCFKAMVIGLEWVSHVLPINLAGPGEVTGL